MLKNISSFQTVNNLKLLIINNIIKIFNNYLIHKVPAYKQSIHKKNLYIYIYIYIYIFFMEICFTHRTE